MTTVRQGALVLALWMASSAAHAADPAGERAADADDEDEQSETNPSTILAPGTTPGWDTPAPGLGLPPQVVANPVGGMIGVPPPGTFTVPLSPDGWRFDFHGFVNAPLSLGWSSLPLTAGGTTEPGPGQHALQLRSPAQTPDANYKDWRYAGVMPASFVQLNFSVGTPTVRVTVVYSGNEFASAGFLNVDQRTAGLSQGFVTFNFFDLLQTKARLQLNVGAFGNRYGAPGIYDAGRYGFFLFGQTGVMGETATLSVPLGDWTLQFEHGVGIRAVDPQIAPLRGATLLHHAHVGVVWRNRVQVAAHYLTSWTQDQRASLLEPDGRLTVTGGEVRLLRGRAGEAYLGVSMADASWAKQLAGALNYMHATDGRSLRDMYFDTHRDPTVIRDAPGTGWMRTLLAQYSVGLHALLGKAPAGMFMKHDVRLTAFTMITDVTSRDADANDGIRKLKVGADVAYLPVPWASLVLRVDSVAPDSSNADESYSIVSPMAVVRTTFVTNETIVLQYSHYSYGSAVRANVGGFSSYLPDADVLQLSATAWW